jgi:lipopolysaccharide export system protein LptC
MTLYAEGEAPWQGEAAFGYLRRAATGTGDEELVFLRQDVRLEQHRADGSHLRLTAPSLYLYPDRQYAETEQDVMIETRVGTTRAEGMQADLKSGHLRLTSRQGSPVHTILLPDQFK